VKASLIRKYHIINLPYSTLKGLFPPLHNLVGVTAVVVDMIESKISLQKYWLLFKKGA
jgi:hypothetical protein